MNENFTPEVFMHINYLEQGQSLEEVCTKAVDWGFDGVEFRHQSALYGAPERYLDTLAAAVDCSGLAQVSFGFPGPDLMGPDPAERERETDDYIRFLNEIADRFPLGALNTAAGAITHEDPSVDLNAFNLHGSILATEAHWEQAILGFQRIAKTSEERGIRLAFELHPYYLHDLPAPTLRLVEAIDSPAIGANLDYGNLIYYPNPPSPEEVIALLQGRLFLVHLKNSLSYGSNRQTVSLQDGEINHRQFLRLLRKAGYQGALCIEAPRPGDRESFVAEDLLYLKKLISELLHETTTLLPKSD